MHARSIISRARHRRSIAQAVVLCHCCCCSPHCRGLRRMSWLPRAKHRQWIRSPFAAARNAWLEERSRFSLNDKLTSFGEYGSGIPAYLNFIKVVGAMYAIFLLIMFVPIVFYYFPSFIFCFLFLYLSLTINFERSFCQDG